MFVIVALVFKRQFFYINIQNIIKRVVKSWLTDNLVSNGLLNPHQSAYCKHQSTETALLYRVGQLKWSQLTFLLVAF